MLELRASNDDVVEPYAQRFGAKFVPGRKPWEVPLNVAMPCATENELNIDDARQLIKNNCYMVAEVSNMGTTAKAAEYLSENIVFAPGKAVNAGGVSVSGLEMSQNNMRKMCIRDS